MSASNPPRCTPGWLVTCSGSPAQVKDRPPSSDRHTAVPCTAVASGSAGCGGTPPRVDAAHTVPPPSTAAPGSAVGRPAGVGGGANAKRLWPESPGGTAGRLTDPVGALTNNALTVAKRAMAFSIPGSPVGRRGDSGVGPEGLPGGVEVVDERAGGPVGAAGTKR